MNNSIEIFSLFMKTHYKSSYGIRDNCGIAASDLVLFFEKHNVFSERVFGYFNCDIPVHDKLDFTSQMKIDFLKQGLNFSSKEARLNWIMASSYYSEWLKCPHYWVEVSGQIFDPSGVAQFVDSGLSKDVEAWRYLRK